MRSTETTAYAVFHDDGETRVFRADEITLVNVPEEDEEELYEMADEGATAEAILERFSDG